MEIYRSVFSPNMAKYGPEKTPYLDTLQHSRKSWKYMQCFAGLIVVKLKRDLKYRGHKSFEPLRPHIIYEALAHMKSHNKSQKDISIAKGLSSEHIFKFSEIHETQERKKSVTEKITSDGKETSENMNDIEIGYASVEDPLNIHRSASNQTTLVYFNQRLLNFNQYFASDADNIFFARSVYGQRHLRSAINFAMHKIKPGKLAA